MPGSSFCHGSVHSSLTPLYTFLCALETSRPLPVPQTGPAKEPCPAMTGSFSEKTDPGNEEEAAFEVYEFLSESDMQMNAKQHAN